MASPNIEVFSKTLSKTDAKKRLAIPTKSMDSLPSFNRNRAVEIDLIYGTSIWTVQYTISKNGSNKRPSFTSGWPTFVACNGLERGDKISLYKVGSSLYRIEVDKAVDGSRSDQHGARPSPVLPSNHDVGETNLSGLAAEGAGTSQLDAGRQIFNGMLIANEVIHTKDKGKEVGRVIIKLDFSKAYDSSLGFSKWGPHKGVHSLRQGDPLSRFLFIMVTEALHLLLETTQDIGLTAGMKGVIQEQLISHMQFADDTILFLQPEEEYVTNLKCIMFLQSKEEYVDSTKVDILARLCECQEQIRGMRKMFNDKGIGPEDLLFLTKLRALFWLNATKDDLGFVIEPRIPEAKKGADRPVDG
ncbi:hypothetical protein GQ457_17G001520 [Hibiscus cannabinus]